jgi:hypothetical protein
VKATWPDVFATVVIERYTPQEREIVVYSNPAREDGQRLRGLFTDVWKGLDVRLAISEGETATMVRPNFDAVS